MKYQLIDHTADFGIQVVSRDLPTLFADTAHVLFDLLTDVSKLTGADETEIRVSGDDWPDLMVNWLREMLYLWNGEEMLVRQVEILSLSEYELTAKLRCDPYAPDRHPIRQEIKAVTYHDIRVSRVPDGWETRVIFDI